MKKISTVVDLLEIINEYIQYLTGKICFTDNGWPIFSRDQMLYEYPDMVVPFPRRNSLMVNDKARTAICYYCPDKQIYPRFCSVINDLEVYRHYLAVIEPDITLTWDMDQEMQHAIMLVDQLFLAVLAVNGIKVIFNTRSGFELAGYNYQNIPRHAVWASGFLGCDNSKNFFDASRYTSKLLCILPSRLIIYGKNDPLITEGLNLLGFDFHYYPDYHTASKRRLA